MNGMNNNKNKNSNTEKILILLINPKSNNKNSINKLLEYLE